MITQTTFINIFAISTWTARSALREDIDLRPDTSEGIPDILIDDRLVLEVKLKLNKAERDRLLGQCAGYSREWVTWVVLIDTPMHRVRELEELLAAKGLGHILVFAFS